MRTLRLAAFAFGLALAPPIPAVAAQEDPDPVVDRILRAAKARDAGDLEAAAALFAEADEAAGGRSLPAVAGLCQVLLQLDRNAEAVAATERWVALARSPAERAGGNHYLGVAFHGRALDEHWQGMSDRIRRDQPGAEGAELAGDASMRAAVAAFRRAQAEATEGRQFVLLSLADALVWLRDFAEAVEVLDEYAAAGGDAPAAADLRCLARHAVDPKGGPRQVGGEVETPVKVHAPPPQYTAAARKARTEGAVVLRAIIDETGAVACAQVLKGLPHGLAASALATVKTWRFQPARLGGEPLAVYYQVTVNFTLGGRQVPFPGAAGTGNRP